MDVLTFTETRQNLKDVMDRVVEDKTPIVISRQKAEAVVMVSLSEWNAIEETMHILSRPANSARIRSALQNLAEGRGEQHDLIEP